MFPIPVLSFHESIEPVTFYGNNLNDLSMAHKGHPKKKPRVFPSLKTSKPKSMTFRVNVSKKCKEWTLVFK